MNQVVVVVGSEMFLFFSLLFPTYPFFWVVPQVERGVGMTSQGVDGQKEGV